MRTDDYSLIWKAISAPIRRQILDLLRERPYTTGEIAKVFDVSRFVVMKHLSALEQSGLITVRKQGRERWNTLNPIPLQLIYERWIRPYEAAWSQSLLQLKNYVEGGPPVIEKKTQDQKEAGQLNIVNMINTEFDFTFLSSPSRVFDALIHHITAWWGYPYVHQDTTNIILEPFVGGRFYEIWGRNDRGALWATVSFIKQDEELRLVGPIGLPEPSHSVVTMHLKPEGNHTLLHFSLKAFGKFDARIQTTHEAGWKDLLGIRLRAFVERDIRYGLDYSVGGWFEDDKSNQKND